MGTNQTEPLRFIKFIVTVALMNLGATSILEAERYELHFSDPIGDSPPYIDITGMDFSFDPITGAYDATISATSAQFFSGEVWVNLNLLNLDRLAMGSGSELLAVAVITGQWAPEMKLNITGTDELLTTWRAQERVAPGQFRAEPPHDGPVPPGVGFDNTSARTFAVNGIAFHYMDDMGIDQSAPIQTVPEPSAFCFVAAGLVIIGLRSGFRLLRHWLLCRISQRR